MIILFVLGLALGSFLNVIALRYNPEKFLLGKHVIGGRSQCSSCHKTLRWFELIPLVSFFLQRGKCRQCNVRLSFQYPIVELLSGIILVVVPYGVKAVFFWLPTCPIVALSCIWILVFLILLLISLIDIRLQIIPDELQVALVVLGITMGIILVQSPLGDSVGSFMGAYSLLLFTGGSIVFNRLIAIAWGLGLFGFIVLVTRGRGMGIGDVKLAAVLGLLFGWFDIAIITMVAFIIGGIIGGIQLLRKRTTMKGALPFGPFLALAAFIVFVWGEDLLRLYFGLFPV